jgi:hypothetical protein
MQASNSVSFLDARNFINLREYFGKAVPSMLFVTLEWSLVEVLTILAGKISLED